MPMLYEDLPYVAAIDRALWSARCPEGRRTERRNFRDSTCYGAVGVVCRTGGPLLVSSKPQRLRALRNLWSRHALPCPLRLAQRLERVVTRCQRSGPLSTSGLPAGFDRYGVHVPAHPRICLAACLGSCRIVSRLRSGRVGGRLLVLARHQRPRSGRSQLLEDPGVWAIPGGWKRTQTEAVDLGRLMSGTVTVCRVAVFDGDRVR